MVQIRSAQLPVSDDLAVSQLRAGQVPVGGGEPVGEPTNKCSVSARRSLSEDAGDLEGSALCASFEGCQPRRLAEGCTSNHTVFPSSGEGSTPHREASASTIRRPWPPGRMGS